MINYTHAHMCATLFALVSSLAACGPNVGDPCVIPDAEYQCHTAAVSETNGLGGVISCATSTIADGAWCRSGVGACSQGTCVEPDGAPPSCASTDLAVVPAKGQDYCILESDCASDNPCVTGACGEPDEGACSYQPKPDGTDCGGGLSCFAGSCCVSVETLDGGAQ